MELGRKIANKDEERSQEEIPFGEPKLPFPPHDGVECLGPQNWIPRFLIGLLAPFFRRMTVSPEEIDRIRWLAERGGVIYVMRTASLLDFLYLCYLCQREKLPVPRFANGIHPFFWRPVWQVLRRAFALLFARLGFRRFRGYSEADFLTSVAQAGGSAMLFLRSSHTFLKFPTAFEGEALEQALVRLQCAVSRPIYVVPQLIFWHKRPRRLERSIIDILFGATDYPGKIRKIGIFFRNFLRATVYFSDAVSLQEFLRETHQRGEPERAPRKLRLMLRYYLAREERVIAGPPQRSRSQVIEEVLGLTEVRDGLIEMSRKLDQPIAATYKEARKILREIVANHNPRVVEFLHAFFTQVWRRLFEGLSIDEEAFHRLRELAKDHSIVLLPNHRSHVDYLVLSYLFYQKDMMIPHIAAGINLSFWPLGPIFRSAGAFFIRRSFKGERLYSLLLEKYLKTLVRRGYPIEFFIEGTRSRSGKMLYPKLGLLSMMMRIGQQLDQKILFIPISIVYERLLEEKAYTEELEGGEKRRETLGGVLKAGRFLMRRYGRVYVEIGKPLTLPESLSSASEGRSDQEFREVVQGFGIAISHEINRATIVTPVSLLATLLLSHQKRGISRDDLALRFRFQVERFKKEGIRLSEAFADIDVAFHQALQLLEKGRHIRSLTLEGLTVYYVDEDERPKLDYYKNNIIHFFVDMGFTASALLSCEGETVALDVALERFQRLHQIFRLEFLISETKEREEHFHRWVQEFLSNGLIEAKEGDRVNLLRRGLGRLSIYRGFIENFVEGYIAVAKAIAYHRFHDVEEREMVRKIQKFCERLYALGDVLRKESISSVMIQNALSLFSSEGAIFHSSVEKEGRRESRWSLPVSGTRRIREVQEELLRYLR